VERIGLIGISHRRATAEEIARFSRETAGSLWLAALRERLGVEELVYIATCNRVELLYVSREGRPSDRVLEDFVDFFLPAASPEERRQAAATCFALSGEAAVKHLLSVVCGLDSLVLGDVQITGQFRRALVQARELGLCGPVLGLVGDEALKASKRVRSGVDFGERPTSVAEVAARALRQAAREQERFDVVLVGAGEMIRKTAARLAGWRRARLHFVNRTAEAARRLAEEHGGTWEALASFQARPRDFDALVAGTASAEPVIRAGHLAGLPERDQTRLLLDLGLPADIELAAGELPGFERLDVLTLGREVAGALRDQELLLREARPLLRWSLEQVRRRLLDRDLGPAARRLRERVEERVRQEVHRWLRGPLAHLSDEDRRTLETLAGRLAGQAVQVPISNMRQVLQECTCGGAVQAALAADPGAPRKLHRHLHA